MLHGHFKSLLSLFALFSLSLLLASVGAQARPSTLAEAPAAARGIVGNLFARSISAMTIKSISSSSKLVTSGTRPVGAFGTTYRLSKGDLFVWQSKSPHNQADSEAVVIITHGVDRNANDYWTTLNNAFKTANSAGLPNAPLNTLRVSPLFFDIGADSRALNATTLAWGRDNSWCLGEGSVHPANSDLSSLAVYDELIKKFSNRVAFPKVKQITLVGHGCGGITVQRYAALNQGTPSGVNVRYVVGNPSTMLYFTTDRPSAKFNPSSCPAYNDYFFGLNNYYIPYPEPSSAAAQFKSYAARDVRYLVSLDDNGGGDQSCEAKAAGGVARKSRTLSYWKYINLLAGKSASSLSSFPGTFPNINNSKAGFATTVAHKLYQLSGVGHNANAVLTSKQGRQAIFG